MLVDHPDALGDGMTDPLELQFLTPEEDLAGIGVIQAEDHIDQSALACPVLTEQAMDLALVEDQIDILVGDHAGERLGDAANLEDWGVRTVAGQGITPRMSGIQGPRLEHGDRGGESDRRDGSGRGWGRP